MMVTCSATNALFQLVGQPSIQAAAVIRGECFSCYRLVADSVPARAFAKLHLDGNRAGRISSEVQAGNAAAMLYIDAADTRVDDGILAIIGELPRKISSSCLNVGRTASL